MLWQQPPTRRAPPKIRSSTSIACATPTITGTPAGHVPRSARAHGAIGQVDNLAAFIDAEVNIYFPQFYKLHVFINNNFIGKLLGYALQTGLVQPTILPDRWLAMSKDFILEHIEEHAPSYIAQI